MVYENPQAKCSNPAQAVPKGNGYRLVGDFKAVNQQSEPLPAPPVLLEEQASAFAGAALFMTVDLDQGYWQMPLAANSQELFAFVTQKGLYTPTRMPQGVTNATSYFQGTLERTLSDLVRRICLVYVDDVIIWGRNVWELMDHFSWVVKKMMEVGLFVAADKVTLYAREVKWCGKLYSGTGVWHDPERIRGLVEMRRPETVSELMQFLQAANWMRLSLPDMDEVVSPLRALLERKLKGTTRTKRVASRKVISEEDWSEEIQAAWQSSRELLEDAVQLNFRKQDFRVLMFPDASDLFWGGFLTQVPEEDLVSGIPVVDMAHEPLGIVSGGFKGSQLNWAVVDKEAFAILSVCRRLSYLLWDGFDIFCDHRNLANIFSPVACAATLSKLTSQRLLSLRTFMSEFSYVIRHIPGAEHHWGDLLSRLRSVGGRAADSGKEVPVCVRSIAVVVPTGADYSFPSMGEIRDRQDIYTDGKAVLDSPLGSVVRGENGLCRVDYGGMQVIWVPPAERSLQVRLIVCAHIQEAGHRGVCATMHRLGA